MGRLGSVTAERSWRQHLFKALARHLCQGNVFIGVQLPGSENEMERLFIVDTGSSFNIHLKEKLQLGQIDTNSAW